MNDSPSRGGATQRLLPFSPRPLLPLLPGVKTPAGADFSAKWLNTQRLAGLTHPLWDGKAALPMGGSNFRWSCWRVWEPPPRPSFPPPRDLCAWRCTVLPGSPYPEADAPPPGGSSHWTKTCFAHGENRPQYGLLAASLDATLASTPSPARRPLHPCPCCPFRILVTLIQCVLCSGP